MKITDYSIGMKSQHEFRASYTKSETLNTWRDKDATNDSNSTPKSTGLKNVQQWLEDELKISEQAQEALKKQTLNTGGVSNSDEVDLSEKDQLKIHLLESLLSTILGRKIKFHLPKKIHPAEATQAANELNAKIANLKTAQGSNQPVQARQGWGMVYQRQESYQESERLSFSANGILKTADGREIKFEAQLQMSREFATNNNVTVKAGDALIDPLVINYAGPAAQLTSTKYKFDLDADGREDQVSFLKEGSGFLALDQNNDGMINNGQELFGPATGNGFSELAQYDQDRNGWIDESDPIFNKLRRIWTKDDQGKDTLFALGEKGIGAIFLGNIGSRIWIER